MKFLNNTLILISIVSLSLVIGMLNKIDQQERYISKVKTNIITELNNVIISKNYTYETYQKTGLREDDKIIKSLLAKAKEQEILSYNNGYRHGQLYAYDNVVVCGASPEREGLIMAEVIVRVEGQIEDNRIVCEDNPVSNINCGE